MQDCYIEEKLKKYTVRISTIGSTEPTIGSGILLETGSKEWIYVLSALHVLKDWFVNNYDFSLQFFYPNEGGEDSFLVSQCRHKAEICYIPVEDIPDSYPLESGYFDNDMFEEYYEKTYRDIVLIRIARSELIKPSEKLSGIKWIFSDNVGYKTDLVGWGFSKSSKTPVLNTSYLETKLNAEKRLQMVYTKNYSGHFSEMLRGFSGTGLVRFYSEVGPVLCGVVTGCIEDEQNNRYYAVSPEVLLPVLLNDKYQKGDHPWEASEKWTLEPPKNLMDSQFTSLKKRDIDNIDSQSIKLQIQRRYKSYADSHPLLVLKNEHPFYEIGGCEIDKTYCPDYWYGTFWADLMKEICNANSTIQWNTEYICSESGDNENMSSFVRRLITSGLVSEQINKDSILIWQSRKNPDRRTAKKNLFNNIIGNIVADNPDALPNGYDLMDGESPQYALIHRKEILEKIAGCENWDEVKEEIRGLADNVWK